jgi:hypothetical protein
MKQLYLLLISLFGFLSFATAQTIYSDDFTAGAAGWTLGSAGNGDAWIVNDVYTCSTNTPNNGGGNYLHIFAGVGDSCASSNGGFGDWICYATMNSGVSTVGFSSVNISFSWLCNGQGFGFYNDGTFDFSVDSGKTWTNVTTPVALFKDQSSWTSTTITSTSYPALLNDAYLLIRFGWTNTGAGLDPSFAVDNVVISGTGGVTCSNVGGSASADPASICSGLTTTVNLTGSSGSIQWQQSPDGSTSWVNVSGGSGATLSSYITPALTGTTYYRAALTQSGCPDVYSSVSSVTVIPNVTPSVKISDSLPSDTICAGQRVSFTASGTNEGNFPSFAWFVNNTLQSGATADTFSSSTLKYGDVIVCELSVAGCASPAHVYDTVTLKITVTPIDTASVSISVNPPGLVCSGTEITFTASDKDGGSLPSYQWEVNGTTQTGATDSFFSISSLANQDVVSLFMLSNAKCVTGNPAFASDTVSITICSNITGVIGENSFVVSPNPSSGVFDISFSERVITVQIFDVQGRMVIEKVPEADDRNKVIVDISNKPAGVYFLHAITSQGIINGKLLLE